MDLPKKQNSICLQKEQRLTQCTRASDKTGRSLSTRRNPTKLLCRQMDWQLFEIQKLIQQKGEISSKLNQKAISWLMTLCWSKNIDDECLWQTIFLYNILKTKKAIKKNELQLILSTCLILITKSFSSNPLRIKDLVSPDNSQITITRILQMQGQILQLLDFNITIPHKLYFMTNNEEQQEQLIKIGYVCELLMLSDDKILWNEEKIADVIDLFEFEYNYNERVKYIKDEVKMILKLKQSKIVTKKYQSKFDIQTFHTMLV